MKTRTRLIIVLSLAVFIALSWTACSSDGYASTGTTVYVSHGYGGYGPGWGYGWGGYGGYGGYGGGYYGPRW